MTRVLLVDDSVLIRSVIKNMLVQENCEVVGEAGTGRDAIAKAASLSPDVILMDYNMPDLNGIEVARQILAGNANVNIIMITSIGTAEHRERASQVGIKGYLTKPFKREDIAAKLSEVLGIAKR